MTEGDPPARKATRRDVARRAGVSDAVVSYTLNGGAAVAPATAQRVREAVAALGYHPNLSARALRSGSSRTLALLAPASVDRVFANPFFAEFASAVEDRASADGYALHMATARSSGPDSMLERVQDFAARQVDGVLIVPGDAIDPARLDAIGVPWLQVNSPRPVAGVHSIGPDLRAGAYAATRHILEHGHHRIAFLGETFASPPELRLEGWRAALEDAGRDARLTIQTPFTREGGYASGLLLAQLADRPTAVFAVSDLVAIGLLRALHESGIRVPDEVAVVSFDGSWEAEYSWPALTSYRQPIERMAEAAVARLLERGEPRHESFEGELVVRASCGPH